TPSSLAPSTRSSPLKAWESSKFRHEHRRRTVTRKDSYVAPVRNAQTESCSTTNDTHAPSLTRTPDTSTPTVPTKASTNSLLTTIRQPSFHWTPQSGVP